MSESDISSAKNKHIICCPPSYPKSKNTSLFSGSLNNPGSMLSPGITYARNINNTLVGNVSGKTTTYYKKVNLLGSYSGAPYSQSSPRNSF
jgi:hypothetical protein